MKRFPKLLITLLVLAMAFGIFAAMPVAAADYQAIKITTSMLEIGHYETLAMDGAIIHYTPASDYEHEIGCIIDNKNNGGYWSSGYKYSSLKDNGGTTVPVIMIDVTKDGAPTTIDAYSMRLRDYFDCEPLHFEVQAIVEANSKKWVSVIDRKVTVDEWTASPTLQFDFPAAVTAYKVRILFYDIGEPNIAKDNNYDKYPNLLGDETRFTLAEIDLLQKKADSGNAGGTTNRPTTGGQTPTRPAGIQIPTKAPSQSTTQAPTQAPTKAPAQNTTQAPTKAPAQTTTQAPTQAPTKAPDQATTVAPTQPATQNGTVAPTEPATIDPNAPTEPTVEATVDPSAPTVDPSAPTEEPTVAPTEETTEAPTTAATEPEATTGTTDTTTTEEPKDNTAIIIIAIVAALAVAGGVVFFIIKKKKNG